MLFLMIYKIGVVFSSDGKGDCGVEGFWQMRRRFSPLVKIGQRDNKRIGSLLTQFTGPQNMGAVLNMRIKDYPIVFWLSTNNFCTGVSLMLLARATGV